MTLIIKFGVIQDFGVRRMLTSSAENVGRVCASELAALCCATWTCAAFGGMLIAAFEQVDDKVRLVIS